MKASKEMAYITLKLDTDATTKRLLKLKLTQKHIGVKTGPHSLPLARIKKIMKNSGEDVKMISGEAPIIFSKACELFIEELTRRSWIMAIQGKRRTLHKEDLASAVIATDIFDFLITLVSSSESHAVGGATNVMEVETIDCS
ncbi:hypothetical protein JHK82_037544 [Glycine max]|nr:hypothetical protein JHK85_038293 [Glycine max]KAG4978268.1 hypothetical protein JHK86_037742 [Glycine max]KAG5114275.1 hypothetical protein JHK82_037544 [Glycine max]KAG5131557.1 hypothetical protein JHK84_037954 [Glycine max]